MKGWVITRDAADGTKRYDACWWIGSKKKSRTFQRRKGADTYLTNMVKRVQDGTYVDVQPALMSEVFDRWLEHSLDVRVKEGSLKASTAKSYRSMLAEHLKPAFGAYRSDRFTLLVVEHWRAGIAAKIAAGAMAPRFYVNVRNLLHAVIEWARHPERRYLAHDPLAGLPKLRVPRAKKRPHFEPAQIAELLKVAAATPPDDSIIKAVLFSGLRRGELFALQWPDVDAGNGQDGGRLHVRRSIYQGSITTPKTDDSDRVVDVPQRLLDDLEVYRVMHPPIGEGFIFRTEQGRPLDPDNPDPQISEAHESQIRRSGRNVCNIPCLYARAPRRGVGARPSTCREPAKCEALTRPRPFSEFRIRDNWHHRRLVPILEQAKLRLPKSGLHSLRHSYVSLLAAQGEDIHYISRQVGHSSTQLTQDVYRHVFAKTRAAAMQRLDRWVPLGSEEPVPSGAHPASQAETAGTGGNTE